MILPQLLWRFFRHRDDAVFYEIQARDAVRWLESRGLRPGPGVRVLDLGCGHGVFGGLLKQTGCAVTFADEANFLLPQFRADPFHAINLDRDPLDRLGEFDVVVCSNVLEHLSQPHRFLSLAHHLLAPGGSLYLSWTNWLSPWGGHEFSPLHYLGPSLGPAVYDAMGKQRFHKPGKNLFVTYIGRELRFIRAGTQLAVKAAAPRYFTELSWLMRCPVIREFVAWNCALLLQRKPVQGA
jgi:SAM-dependent methyltransferase